MDIGDKVRFDSYIPMNIINNKPFRNTLSGAKVIKDRMGHLKRTPTTVEYKTILFKENTPLEGIYVGHFFKKLNRKYRLSTKEELEAMEAERLTNRRSILRHIQPTNLNQYSSNPRRLDDPRKLDKIAIVSVGRRMIGVPMSNILKNDSRYTFRTI
jgi:hypothetical protein